MAKKKTPAKKTQSGNSIGNQVEVKNPGARPKRKKARKAKTENKAKETKLVLTKAKAATLIPTDRRDSLSSWFSLYLGIEEGNPNEPGELSHTFKAKRADLERFLNFMVATSGDDHPDSWTKSVSKAFRRRMQTGKSERTGKPLASSTVDRVLATLRHAARWIEKQRPFLAGYPLQGIKDTSGKKSAWLGISPVQITRMTSAAEQLIQLNTRTKQMPRRNYALLVVGLDTALRPFEILGLELSQYDGKAFHNVLCKGSQVATKVIISTFAREVLDDYIELERPEGDGPLFQTKNGNPLAIQNYDDALKSIASQANSRLSAKEQIHISPHLLRHTSLRKMCETHGIQYAKERANHVSDRHIWRYVQPSEEQFEEAIESFWE